ncbi:MAG: hypothetical protein QM490_04795 [Candidatus Gracilibacteria bacterium]
MFKKIFVLVFITFFIASCGDEEDVIFSTGLKKAETQNLSIEIPSNWDVIKDTENVLPTIKEGKIELAVASTNIVNGFSNNLLILSDELSTFTSSKDFSMLNNIGASADYLNYNKLSSKEFKFIDEELSILYIFEAKYNLDTPTLKFLQTAHICNQNKAFFLTLALPTSITDTSKYELFLSTFTCK